jgi:hypothetical protein
LTGGLKPLWVPQPRLGKERFLSLLGLQFEEQEQEKFYYAKNSNNEVVNIIENFHNFTAGMLTSEFDIQSNPDNNDYAAF